MATINIYVPDSLKTDMDAVGNINWSGICQKCIKAEITRTRAAEGSKADAVARINAAGSSRFNAGFADGRQFALADADIDDFDVWMDYPEIKAECEEPKEAVTELVARAGGDGPSYFFGDGRITWRYLDGFHAGLMEVFYEIRFDLEATQLSHETAP